MEYYIVVKPNFILVFHHFKVKTGVIHWRFSNGYKRIKNLKKIGDKETQKYEL